MKRTIPWLLVFMVTVFLCGFLLPVAYIAEILIYLPLGWMWFLNRVVLQMEVDPWSLATAILCLVLLALGVHYFCSWLSAQVQKAKSPESPTPIPWPWRRTFSVIGVTVLMFVAGIAAVGVTHQVAWLVNSPEPLVESSFRKLIARLEDENNLKQMVLAAHEHHDHMKRLPVGAIFDDHGRALHGWQTVILPYLEQATLYQQIDLKRAWDDSTNAEHFKKELPVFQSPRIDQRFNENGFALSHHASNIRVIGGNKSMALGDITDGMARTLLFGQVGENFKPWGYPRNWRDPALGLNTSPDGFGNEDKTGAIFAFADGHVRFLRSDISPRVLHALSTPNGGEDIEQQD